MTDSPFIVEWLHGPEEELFYTRTYKSSGETKAVLVFIHGFIEHIARYEHVFPAYAAAGIAVFTFDQRGHGRTALGDLPHGTKGEHRLRPKFSYGKTSSEHQRGDIYWAVNHAGETLASWGKGGETIPVFLAGHSMGGALVLSVGCSPPKPLAHPLAGIIATSPFVAQTHPVNKIVRGAGGVFASILPWVSIKTAVKPEDLSHDKKVGEEYAKDPYVQFNSTFRAVSTMLNLGEYLLATGYNSWPKDLPLLIVHGTSDEVTSAAASERFYNLVEAEDKTYTAYEGGFHELQNEPEFKQRLNDEIVAWILKHVETSSPAQPTGAKL